MLVTVARDRTQGPGKVVFMQPEAASACVGLAGVVAVGCGDLVWPSRYKGVMARLCSIAITRGAFPAVTSDLSSW